MFIWSWKPLSPFFISTIFRVDESARPIARIASMHDSGPHWPDVRARGTPNDSIGGVDRSVPRSRLGIPFHFRHPPLNRAATMPFKSHSQRTVTSNQIGPHDGAKRHLTAASFTWRPLHSHARRPAPLVASGAVGSSDHAVGRRCHQRGGGLQSE